MRTLALVVIAALVAAAPAAAKELKSVAVCGPNDCVTYTSPADMEALVEVDPSAAPPAPAGPFYVLSVRIAEGDRTFGWKTFYVPSAHRQAVFDEGAGATRWSDALPGARRLLDAAARNVQPFPTPRLAAVRVDGRTVSGEPQGYIRLFAAGSPTDADPPRWDWVPVDLVAPATTPWTGSDRDLAFSPSGRLVERGSVRTRIPDALAADVAAGRTLTFTEGGLPWSLLAAAAIAAAAVALAGALWIRRRAPNVASPRVAAPRG